MSLVKEPVILNWKKIMAWLAIIIVSILGTFKLYQSSRYIANNWQEIKFAYEKPQMVRDMREKYQKGVEELEQSFNVTPTPTPSPIPSVEVSKK